MQCFMKKEDKSLIDVDNVETSYFDNCVSFGLLFASFVSSMILSRASLAFSTTYFTFLSGVFMVFSCWRYPCQHCYDFCAQIEMCVVAV